MIRSKTVRLLRAVLLFALPTGLVRRLVNRVGYNIESGARIGFSIVLVDALEMAPGASIGHLNLVKGPYRVTIETGGGLGHFNFVSGSLARGPQHVSLAIGEGSKITAFHSVDMTNSVRIGKHSTIAGHGSQLWTHGYVHAPSGPQRYRVDGEILIGDNVNVGSGSIISAGVRLADGVMVGTGTPVAKSLIEPGYYVSAPLRLLKMPIDPEDRTDLVREISVSGDIVYRKDVDESG